MRILEVIRLTPYRLIIDDRAIQEFSTERIAIRKGQARQKREF